MDENETVKSIEPTLNQNSIHKRLANQLSIVIPEFKLHLEGQSAVSRVP